MSRVKFRFYSLSTCSYVDDLEDYVIDGNGNIYSKSDLSTYNELFELSHVIIKEQFTGLKDKNGIEIYEGDIVQMYYQPMHEFGHKKSTTTRFKFTDYNECTAIGEMLDIRVVKWIGGALMLHCDNGGFGHARSFNQLANPGESFEIIGSIHQNPELLK